MKILSYFLQECNIELCEKLLENDVFNKKELMVYIIELLCCELSGFDIIFLRNLLEVLIVLLLEIIIEVRKVKIFLSLLIFLIEKLEKNVMFLKKLILLIFLKEIKGMLELGKKGKIIFFDFLREKLYNLVNFKILLISEMI